MKYDASMSYREYFKYCVEDIEIQRMAEMLIEDLDECQKQLNEDSGSKYEDYYEDLMYELGKIVRNAPFKTKEGIVSDIEDLIV